MESDRTGRYNVDAKETGSVSRVGCDLSRHVGSEYLNQAVIGPGVVATAAEARKRLKYEVISRTYEFSPIAIETFGALSEEATEFFKDLAVRIQNVTMENCTFEFLMQRLSVSMQRGNAVCVLGTLPSTSNLDICYFS
jgi:hypothetical protein